MHRAIIQASRAVVIDPGQSMFHPVVVIAVGKVLARVTAAALLPVRCRVDGNHRLSQQILESSVLPPTTRESSILSSVW